MLIRVIRKLLSVHAKARSHWWLLRAEILSCLNHGSFQRGKKIKVDCPIRCDGSGVVVVGDVVSLGYSKAPRYGSGEILIQARSQASRIEIGSHTSTSNNISMIANKSIIVGDNCLIGDRVTIIDSDFHEVDPYNRKQSIGSVKPVSIGNNVWLGSGALIMKGVSIGDNSVIAAGSIVVKSIPANVIAAGVPAKILRKIDGLQT